ncbi:MAG: alpha/beta fold hydrolase [Myxococcaceae bacterium]|nr:alpha/beta fold hydrolase [Myxococcaceae bacterium]
MKTISIGGRAYAYEDVGEGVPLLLFHGFPFTAASWAAQRSSPPKGFRLLLPDHRGFGHSALADGVSTMEAMAEDGLALLDALKLPSAVVGGLSMGGYVALALARLDPGRVRGLVLVDTQSLPDDDAGKARRETVATDVLANGVNGLVDGMLPKLFAAATPAAVRAPIEALMRAQTPAAVAAAARGMATRTDAKDLLARFAGPTLVVVGAEDAITPPEKAKVMAALVAGARLEVVPGAGHLVPVEQPASFKTLLESFAAALG